MPPFPRWWPPENRHPWVKLFTIPDTENVATILKEMRFTVEVTPVDFTDPDHSNNKQTDMTAEIAVSGNR